MASSYRTPLTPTQLAAHRKEAAEERRRRGFTTFTRESVREAVMGETKGENRLQRSHRYSQVDRREK